jgi:hypothetical protein
MSDITVPPYHDDRGDLQEAWMRGYHAALAAAPAPDAGLDVERLRSAYYNVAELSICPDPDDIAAEYAALSRQAEKETA